MDYRCPQCRHMLRVPTLFFSDISACKSCGQRVVLGDFIAFFIAMIAMIVMALSCLYLLAQHFDNPYIPGGYAISIGMATGICVLLLLGRAIPYKSMRSASRPTTKL